MQQPAEGIFHVSEEAGIKLFVPRPSPSYFAAITGDVVFAISGKLLHNYLLPRNCPRVTFYAGDDTSQADRDRFLGTSAATYIIIVESGWYKQICDTVLTCYEFAPDNFTLLDACAGYHISYEPEKPVAEQRVANIIEELLKRDVELKFTPSLIDVAAGLSKSTLNFSLIRMRNAKGI